MQINISSRATAAVHLNVAACRLIGAGCRVLGIVAPQESLDGLSAGGATLLTSCPSYLGELVVAARRRGMAPRDFRLRRIDVGGEVLSPSLAAAARQTFGVDIINDSFGMTEVMPVTGRTCSQSHLHHDVNMGHVELLDLSTGEPAVPGALGTVVVTPYFPYRDCMPVLRYDTRDVVRCLSGEPLTCEVSGLPATSSILGKADSLLRLSPTEVISPRQLVEAVEALPTQPWPARFAASVRSGRLVLSLPAAAIDGFGEAAAREHFAEQGLDADLFLVGNDQAKGLRPLRSDLHETSFVTPAALIGE